MTTKTYTSRPKPRQARLAWDYFMDRDPALKTTKRTLELFYSPNIQGDGPGWVLEIGHLEADTLHWKGGEDISHTVLSGNLQSWAARR